MLPSQSGGIMMALPTQALASSNTDLPYTDSTNFTGQLYKFRVTIASRPDSLRASRTAADQPRSRTPHQLSFWTDGSFHIRGYRCFPAPGGIGVVQRPSMESPSNEHIAWQRTCYVICNAFGSNNVEMLAILQALTEAWGQVQQLSQYEQNKHSATSLIVNVFSDSQSALQAIATQGKRSSAIPVANPTAKSICSLVDRLGHLGAHVHLQWVPGHCGDRGNQLADRAARLSLLSDMSKPGNLTPNQIHYLFARNISCEEEDIFNQSRTPVARKRTHDEMESKPVGGTCITPHAVPTPNTIHTLSIPSTNHGISTPITTGAVPTPNTTHVIPPPITTYAFPSSTTPYAVPPSTSPFAFPPSTTPYTAPPSTISYTVPPSTNPFAFPPSTTPYTAPPSTLSYTSSALNSTVTVPDIKKHTPSVVASARNPIVSQINGTANSSSTPAASVMPTQKGANQNGTARTRAPSQTWSCTLM